MARQSWGKRSWSEQNRTMQERRGVVAAAQDLKLAGLILDSGDLKLESDDPEGENIAWWAEADEPEAVHCPRCGGDAGLLGTLGKLTHYRCRYCGWDFNSEGV